MAIVTRTTAKSYFKTGDKPTQSQFGDFIDSSLFYEDTSDLGRQLVSASSATSARSLLGAGTVGNNLFIATTTASGQNQLGGGTVGKALFEANTTASAQQNIGGGTVGRQIFEAITTASATNIVLQQATSSVIGVSYLSSPITIANNSTTPNTDIDFSAGNFIFSDKTGQAIATAMTKKLQSSGSWSAGNNGNMLLSGARANSSTYHLFALYKTDGTVDYGAMLGIAGTAPNPTSVLPSGYTKWQLIESIITDSSGNIISFTQIGNRIELVSSIQTHTTVSQAVATETLRTLSAAIPVGRQVMAFGTAFTQYITAANNPYLKVYSAQMVKPTLNASEGQMSTNANSTGPIYGNGFWQAITNTSAQIKTNGSSGSQNININVDGWVSLI